MKARRIAIVLVVVSLLTFAVAAYAGFFSRHVYYFSDATFTTVVGQRYYPDADDECPDDYWQTGTVTNYRATYSWDDCDTVFVSAVCVSNGSYVTCPPEPGT